MELRINETKVENPFVIAALVLFSITLVGGLIGIGLLIVLPIVGVFLSTMVSIAVAILVPIFFWFVIPALMLSIIAWFFGRVFKK